MNVTIIITALAIFLVIISSQIVSYSLSRRRDSVQDYKQITQQLVLPNLNEVILYIEMHTDPRKDYGVERITVNPDEVIAKIQEKASFTDAKLMNALYRYYNALAFDYGGSESKNLSTFEVFFYYLNQANTSVTKGKYCDEQLLETIVKNQKIYGIVFVLTTLLGKDEAIKILSHNWMWEPDFLDKISVRLLEDLITNYHAAIMEEYKLLLLLRTLKASFVDKVDIEPLADLKEYIEEAIEIVTDRYVNYSH